MRLPRSARQRAPARRLFPDFHHRSTGTMTQQLVVVGSLNMDLSVTVPRLPAQGETVLGADVVRGAGGKGANQAVAAARLGAGVKMIGLLGNDAFGEELRRQLAGEGVDSEAVAALPGVPSGLALIVVRQDGENAITLSPGANRHLDAERLAAISKGAALAGPTDTVLLQLEVPLPAVLAAARTARAKGAYIVLNAAPSPEPGPLLEELLCTVDVLVVNETEAATLLRLPASLPGPVSPSVWAERAEQLRTLGPRTAVITLGSAGAVAAAAHGTHHQSGFPIQAVDTVGAGDAFCAQLALALGARSPLDDALREACAAGALAATRPGAQSSLPTRAEVDALLDRTAGTVEVHHAS
ncbi:ribokinase [Streptomyces sp. NPDC004752]